DWTTSPQIGGHAGSSSEGLTRIELIYGSPIEEPHVRINTKWKLPPPRPAISIEDARSRLTRELWLRQVNRPDNLGAVEQHNWMRMQRSAISRRSIPDWTPTAFGVEGVVHDAEVYTQGED